MLVYGHYDVQGVGDLALWSSPPFEPEVRDGRVFARGAADDKGNFWPLLHAACALARAGELPVHVRVLVEGEEEAGSFAAIDWLRADERGADAAIVFDSGMADARTPAITIGLRGIVMCDLTLRCGAARTCTAGCSAASPATRCTSCTGSWPSSSPAPTAGCATSCAPASSRPPKPSGPPGTGCRRATPRWPRSAPSRSTRGAGAELYERTGALPSLDVNYVEAGAPRTVVPATVRAAFSLRLAPRQDAAEMRATLERLLRGALPDGCTLDLDWHTAEPALFAADVPAVRLAAAALERAAGVAPVLVRSGGSIPIVAELAAKGIPTIVTGFVLPRRPVPRAGRVVRRAQPRARRAGRARAAGRAGRPAALRRRRPPHRGCGRPGEGSGPCTLRRSGPTDAFAGLWLRSWISRCARREPLKAASFRT